MSTLASAAISVQYQATKHERHFPAMLIISIGVAEYLFAYHDVAYGVVICLALVIGIYLLLSADILSPHISRCIEALSLSPKYILFTASLPWFIVRQEYLLPGVYSVILALVVWHLYRQGYTLGQLREFGFVRRSSGRLFALGVVLAIPTAVVEYLILRPDPSSPTLSAVILARDAFYMFAFVGVAEEVLFRGIIQNSLITALGRWNGIFLTSALFAIMHMSWRSVPELGFVFLASIMLGYLRVKSGSLIGPLAWHGLNNTLLVGILPYLIR